MYKKIKKKQNFYW